jgi:hypothetical protein
MLAKDRQDNVDRVANVKKAWADDETKLVEAGRLPKEEAERDKAKTKIFGIIESELNKGRVISFEDAYYRFNDQQQQAAAKEAADAKAKAAAAAKKKAGGRVMGGGTGGASTKPAANSNGPIMMDGPAQGTSLADVHASVLAGN